MDSSIPPSKLLSTGDCMLLLLGDHIPACVREVWAPLAKQSLETRSLARRRERIHAAWSSNASSLIVISILSQLPSEKRTHSLDHSTACSPSQFRFPNTSQLDLQIPFHRSPPDPIVGFMNQGDYGICLTA